MEVSTGEGGPAIRARKQDMTMACFEYEMYRETSPCQALDGKCSPLAHVFELLVLAVEA